MTTVVLTPTNTIPIPYDLDDEVYGSRLEELAIAGNTGALKLQLGQVPEIDAATAVKEATLLKEFVTAQTARTSLTTTGAAIAATAFLKTYGSQLGFDVASVRAAITSKLMEIANCGDTKYELRALELLGKHSDIGLFTERSEITFKYKDPQELESAIKERVKRLLNANTIDITPLGMDLDEELGFNKQPPAATPAEQEEIDNELGLGLGGEDVAVRLAVDTKKDSSDIADASKAGEEPVVPGTGSQACGSDYKRSKKRNTEAK
jgi:hypothetical protein